jgi:hypothetical protein
MNAIKTNWMLLSVLLGIVGSLPVLADATGQPLTTAAAVRALSAADAEKHLPVKLRGVVTFYDDGLFSRFVQDDTAGIYLQVTNVLTLQPGQIIELEGVTGAGEFAPVVLPASVKVVGNGTIPAAKPVSVPELLGGADDSQLVEISGTVRAVNFEKSTGNYYLDVVAGGERFTVVAKEAPLPQLNDLLDATVRVRGVCATLFNRQRQLFGVRLLVPNADGLAVEKTAAADPFAVATQPVDSLLRFTPEGVTAHRVKVAGTVTYFEPGRAVFIQDGKLGLQCETTLRDEVKPGDQVEVVGWPAKGEYTPVLEDAIYRKAGSGAEPKPDAVDLNEILTGVHDCRLVQLSAKVLERVDRGVNQFLLLSAGDFVFQAYLPADTGAERFGNLPNGSEISVTGICLIQRGNNWQAGKDWRAKSFRLLLRSPADVQIISAAPASTPPDNWVLILGAMELVVLVVVIRLVMLAKRKSADAK